MTHRRYIRRLRVIHNSCEFFAVVQVKQVLGKYKMPVSLPVEDDRYIEHYESGMRIFKMSHGVWNSICAMAYLEQVHLNSYTNDIIRDIINHILTEDHNQFKDWIVEWDGSLTIQCLREQESTQDGRDSNPEKRAESVN